MNCNNLIGLFCIKSYIKIPFGLVVVLTHYPTFSEDLRHKSQHETKSQINKYIAYLGTYISQ